MVYPCLNINIASIHNASANSSDLAAKNDYAANAGGPGYGSVHGNSMDTDGPPSVVPDDWDGGIGVPYTGAGGECLNMTGVIFQRSCLRMARILDGTTNTYLLGEKLVPWDQYTSGTSNGDNDPAYIGHNKDNSRIVIANVSNPPFGGILIPPMQDFDGGGSWVNGYFDFAFGSAHSSGCSFCLCDGSVRTISYWIDPLIHCKLGIRDDGMTIDPNMF